MLYELFEWRCATLMMAFVCVRLGDPAACSCLDVSLFGLEAVELGTRDTFGRKELGFLYSGGELEAAGRSRDREEWSYYIHVTRGAAKSDQRFG